MDLYVRVIRPWNRRVLPRDSPNQSARSQSVNIPCAPQVMLWRSKTRLNQHLTRYNIAEEQQQSDNHSIEY